MGMPVVTVAAGGLPVVDVTAIAPRVGMPVTEAVNGFGTRVTKVTAGGMAVVYDNWGTTFSQALGINSSGWNNSNLRQIINASALSTSGSMVRLTLEPATNEGFSIDAMYIGQQAASGDVWDMAASPAPVRVTVGGSGVFASAVPIVTDAIVFPLDETKGLVIAVHFNATSSTRGANALAFAAAYNKAGASEAATADVSGYTLVGSAVRLIGKIEVLSGPAPAVPPATAAIFSATDKGPNLNVSGDGLTVTATATTATAVRTDKSQLTGKFYFEVTWTTATGGAGGDAVGIATSAAVLTGANPSLPGNAALGATAGVSGAVFYNTAAQGAANLGAFANGNVCCVAVDKDNNKIWFRKNGGNWNNNAAANPATNVGGIDISTVFSAAAAFGCVCKNGAVPVAVGNFGQSAFAFTVPSGFVAGPA